MMCFKYIIFSHRVHLRILLQGLQLILCTRRFDQNGCVFCCWFIYYNGTIHCVFGVMFISISMCNYIYIYKMPHNASKERRIRYSYISICNMLCVDAFVMYTWWRQFSFGYAPISVIALWQRAVAQHFHRMMIFIDEIYKRIFFSFRHICMSLASFSIQKIEQKKGKKEPYEREKQIVRQYFCQRFWLTQTETLSIWLFILDIYIVL